MGIGHPCQGGGSPVAVPCDGKRNSIDWCANRLPKHPVLESGRMVKAMSAIYLIALRNCRSITSKMPLLEPFPRPISPRWVSEVFPQPAIGDFFQDLHVAFGSDLGNVKGGSEDRWKLFTEHIVFCSDLCGQGVVKADQDWATGVFGKYPGGLVQAFI